MLNANAAPMIDGSARRKQRTGVRPAFLGMTMLILLAMVSLLVFACGDSTLDTQAPAMTPTASGSQASTSHAPQPTTPAALDPLAKERALHDRIMAEQGRTAGGARGTDSAPIAADVSTAGETLSVTGASTQPATIANGPSSAVLTGGQTPLRGIWNGTAEQLASFLLKSNPSPRFTVSTPVLAGYYVRYCAEAGLRADLLWAQMIHETGYGMYGGDVSPDQNNMAGIGATGGGARGITFTSAEAGVMAQIAHMVAYVYTTSSLPWARNYVDPRFDIVPRGVVSVLSDLNGRWAVPGGSYGEAIEGIARAINSP